MTLPKKGELIDITKRTVLLGAGLGVISKVPQARVVGTVLIAGAVKKTADDLFMKRRK